MISGGDHNVLVDLMDEYLMDKDFSRNVYSLNDEIGLYR